MCVGIKAQLFAITDMGYWDVRIFVSYAYFFQISAVIQHETTHILCLYAAVRCNEGPKLLLLADLGGNTYVQ